MKIIRQTCYEGYTTIDKSHCWSFALRVSSEFYPSGSYYSFGVSSSWNWDMCASSHDWLS